MEKQLIEQLLSNGLSVKKIKSIVEQLDDKEVVEHDLTKTTIANTCGLRLIKCGSCNKKFYEDKFMLNRLNKRYRSCIDCVTRQRKYRQQSNKDNDINNNIHDNGLLAILDKQEDETYNIEPGTNLIDYPHIEPTQEPDFPIEPNTDISNYSHIEPITKHKHHSKQKNKNAIPLQFPEPDNLGVGLFNLFVSK